MPCLEANDSGSGWPVPLKSADPDEQTFSVCVCVCFTSTPSLGFYTHKLLTYHSISLHPSLLLFLLKKKKKKHPILPHSTSLPLYQPNPPPAHFAIFHSLRVNAHYILPSRFRPN